GDLAGPLAETLLYAASAGSDAANPLQHLSFAVPALTPGSQRLRLHNLTTGHATEVMDLSVVPAGTGDQQVLQGFIQQVSAAAGPLAVSLASESLIGPWLTTLKAATSEVLAAMAANSGLVTASNAQRMATLDAASPSSADRELVARHALVLDAMASSTGVDDAVADAAADLATLLMVSAHTGAVPIVAAAIGAQQASGPNCGGASPSATATSWGE